jgi:hypothetical protein
MSTRVKTEEHAPLADFIRTSFVRDQAAITARYPKLNDAFLEAFDQQLTVVRALDSRYLITAEQKKATEQLYAEARLLSNELTFLNSYLSEAGLDTALVTALKENLTDSNIEGALLKIEAVRQFILQHQEALEDEGMAATFPATLSAHKTSLAAQNELQNSFMNSARTLTDANKAQYNDLYDRISKIANAGKLVFRDAIQRNEYSVSRIISRMRAPKHKEIKN